MKKVSLLLLLLTLAVPGYLSAQESLILDRPNELYGGYGAGSLYYFTSPLNHNYRLVDYPYYYNTNEDDPTSIGTFFLGYNRAVTKVLSIGFQISYMHLNQKIEYIGDPYGYDTVSYRGEYNDYLITGMARLTFHYLRKPALTLYSGASVGVTVDIGSATVNGQKDNERKLKPAGQLTLFGLRAGKALAGFLEFGVGTNGIVTAGISYRIKD